MYKNVASVLKMDDESVVNRHSEVTRYVMSRSYDILV